jgi:D-glycero-D-manno-heptose 1,7-bisphosphate phosphatase
MISRAIFLDRDGVINQAVIRNGKPYPPRSAEELIIPEGVVEALAQFVRQGFLLYVVTNQPDVARGTQQRSTVEAIHAALGASLPLNGFYACYHDDADVCACRKPKPGLLIKAAENHGLSLTDSYMIGDRWRDVEAGQRAGCRTVWIDYGYDEPGPTNAADATVKSLPEAASWIFQNERNNPGAK